MAIHKPYDTRKHNSYFRINLGHAEVGGVKYRTPTFAEAVGNHLECRKFYCQYKLALRLSLVGNSGRFTSQSVNFTCYTSPRLKIPSAHHCIEITDKKCIKIMCFSRNAASGEMVKGEK